MRTLRPYDFFLSEDVPAAIEPSNGMMALVLDHSDDCFVNTVIIPPSGWSGAGIRVKLRVISVGDSGAHASFNVRLCRWPSMSDADGPVVGVENIVEVDLFSPNPAVMSCDEVLAEMPDGYEPGQVITLNIAMVTADSTTGIQPRIAAVEYEFL